MTTSTRKKASLHLVVAIAVALGCTSAALSGILATLSIPEPGVQASVA